MPEITKIRQPHGGALNSGGTPGNKGGGRPPNAFRTTLASHFGDVRQDRGTVAEFARDVVTGAVEADPRTRLAAWKELKDEVLAADEMVSAAELRERLARQIDVIQETLPPEQAALLLSRLSPVWS